MLLSLFLSKKKDKRRVFKVCESKFISVRLYIFKICRGTLKLYEIDIIMISLNDVWRKKLWSWFWGSFRFFGMEYQAKSFVHSNQANCSKISTAWYGKFIATCNKRCFKGNSCGELLVEQSITLCDKFLYF